MRVDTEQKLFVGLKLDSEMRRLHADGKVANRPAFKPGDPARLDLFDIKGDLFMGRVVDGSLACDESRSPSRSRRGNCASSRCIATSCLRTSQPRASPQDVRLRVIAPHGAAGAT
jgi:hypothetical protein